MPDDQECPSQVAGEPIFVIAADEIIVTDRKGEQCVSTRCGPIAIVVRTDGVIAIGTHIPQWRRIEVDESKAALALSEMIGELNGPGCVPDDRSSLDADCGGRLLQAQSASE
jgi:hypothetical protein